MWPDFSPFVRAVSACGWLKFIGSDPYANVFTFFGYEMLVSHSGRWFCILGQCSLLSKLPPKGEWYHMCAVWSASSAYFRYYVDGELIGSMRTRSKRSLRPGGPLMLGNRGGAYWARSGFGGQMFFLNFYAQEFSAAEVKSMADMGLCADKVVDEHKEVRLLKWEDILEQVQRRKGTVSDVDLTEWCWSSLASKYKELLKFSAEREVEGVRLEPLFIGTPGHSGEPVSPTRMSTFHPNNPDQCSWVYSKLNVIEDELKRKTWELESWRKYLSYC